MYRLPIEIRAYYPLAPIQVFDLSVGIAKLGVSNACLCIVGRRGEKRNREDGERRGGGGGGREGERCGEGEKEREKLITFSKTFPCGWINNDNDNISWRKRKGVVGKLKERQREKIRSPKSFGFKSTT